MNKLRPASPVKVAAVVGKDDKRQLRARRPLSIIKDVKVESEVINVNGIGE